jgi:hypothetical protein
MNVKKLFCYILVPVVFVVLGYFSKSAFNPHQKLSDLIPELLRPFDVPEQTVLLEDRTYESVIQVGVAEIRRSVLLDASNLLPSNSQLPPLHEVGLISDVEAYVQIQDGILKHYLGQIEHVFPFAHSKSDDGLGTPTLIRENVFTYSDRNLDNIVVCRIHMANDKDAAQWLCPPKGTSSNLFVRLDMKFIMRGK